MLITALQNTINPIITAFPVEIIVETPAFPCAIHAIEGPTPAHNKEGISGYESKVTITILSDDVVELNTYSNTVQLAIEAMAGQTIDTTSISDATFSDESGTQEIADMQGVYYNELQFDFLTINK